MEALDEIPSPPPGPTKKANKQTNKRNKTKDKQQQQKKQNKRKIFTSLCILFCETNPIKLKDIAKGCR